MQDELLQFKLQKVWTLVDLPNGKRAIGTKWVYMNKKDERGIVIKNKARLEVIVNGDSVSPVALASAGAEGPIPPNTAEQKLARKNELKAKSTLMLAIPD
ncbi:putative ribonuclease H-like domain-containing protein [Tanacetum coccineum]